MIKRTLSICILLCLNITVITASETEDNTFGGWTFIDATHNFKNGLYIKDHLEHDNYQYSRMECWYNRFCLGYSILPWLKTNLNYVLDREPGYWMHCLEADVAGTLKSGNLKVNLRERFQRSWTPEQGTASNAFRTLFKVSYHIPDSKFGIYLAPEIFIKNKEWNKTRHYIGCTYSITDFMEFDGYYMYYAFRNKPDESVIGLGFNFNF